MNQTQAQQVSMGDKELLSDSLLSQKNITDTYNNCALESANVDLKNQFLNILNEEQRIAHEVFSEMQGRGWYQTKPADMSQVNQARQKFVQSGQ